jgi:hypothetical protein
VAAKYAALAARPREVLLGNHGHPRVTLRRALERGNLVAAEITAREVGKLDVREALELTALIAKRNRERGRRAAVRWLRLWLDERSGASTRGYLRWDALAPSAAKATRSRWRRCVG